MSVSLSGSGLISGRREWGAGGTQRERGKAEEKSKSKAARRERKRPGDWSRLSQSPLSKGTAPVTGC